MKRREFLKVATTAGVAIALKGCFPTISEEPDIVLGSDVQKNAQKISKLYPQLKLVAEGKGNLRIGATNQDGELDILNLFCVQEDGGERHIALTNEATGETAVLYFGLEGIFPSVRFAGLDGKTLIDANGQEMEYPLWRLGNRAPALATDWLKLGISAAALGLAIFLGAKIIGLIIAAVAFIAYYAMILALIIAGVALLSRGAKWLLDTTGWNLESAGNFFGKQVEEIRSLIEGAKPF